MHAHRDRELFRAVHALGSEEHSAPHGVSDERVLHVDQDLSGHAWANTYPGQLVGWDNAVSNTSGGFLQDQTFDICSQTGGFSITTAFGSGGCSVQPATITTKRLVHLQRGLHLAGG